LLYPPEGKFIADEIVGMTAMIKVWFRKETTVQVGDLPKMEVYFCTLVLPEKSKAIPVTGCGGL
jgi:hypothetical protein